MAGPTVFLKLRGGQVSEETARGQDNVDKVLRPLAQALAQTPIMGTAPVWTSLALDPAFLNLGGGFAIAAYYKDPFFRVWVKGVLTTAAGVAAAALVTTFAPGYRPNETQRKVVEGNGGTFQAVSISPIGEVRVELLVAAGGTLDIDFSFLAER